VVTLHRKRRIEHESNAAGYQLEELGAVPKLRSKYPIQNVTVLYGFFLCG